MVKIVLFIIGLLVCLQVKPGNGDKGAIAGAGVEAGVGVLQSLLDYGVGIDMMIENWSKFPLSGFVAKVEGGKVQGVPTIIRPGMAEFLAAHKTGWSCTGSYGVISWLIEGVNRRLVIMWSAPYNFDFYDNYLAVGLTDSSSTENKDKWFDYMYYDEGDITGLKFKRMKFGDEVAELLYDDDPQFQIHATMGTSHMSKARVVFRPKKDSDIAPSIKGTVKK